MNEYQTGSEQGGDQGVMVGVILVMTILIVGGVYMVFSRINNPMLTNTAPEATAGLPKLEGTSTAPEDLQADAAKLEFQSLNSDINNIDQAINR